MQVERQRGSNPGGERRTGEQYLGICPVVGDNPGKLGLIPHTSYGRKRGSQDLALLDEPKSD